MTLGTKLTAQAVGALAESIERQATREETAGQREEAAYAFGETFLSKARTNHTGHLTGYGIDGGTGHCHTRQSRNGTAGNGLRQFFDAFLGYGSTHHDTHKDGEQIDGGGIGGFVAGGFLVGGGSDGGTIGHTGGRFYVSEEVGVAVEVGEFLGKHENMIEILRQVGRHSGCHSESTWQANYG